MYLKNILFIIVAFFLIPLTSFAQEKEKQLSIDAELNWLLHYKREYEKYSKFADFKNDFTVKNVNKRDSVYKLYTDRIEQIRNSPEKYLTHINSSIKNNKVEYDGPPRILYDYVSSSTPFDPDLHFVSRLELYKIVKKYIFDQNGKILPHRTEAYLKAVGVERLSMPVTK